jgi:hypothetical protein
MEYPRGIEPDTSQITGNRSSTSSNYSSRSTSSSSRGSSSSINSTSASSSNTISVSNSSSNSTRGSNSSINSSGINTTGISIFNIIINSSGSGGGVGSSSSSSSSSSKKCKAIPVTGRGGPWGCKMSRIPHCLDNRLTDVGKVVSPMQRPLLYSPETLFLCFWYSFLLEA